MQLANEQFFSILWNGLPKNNGFYYTWGLQLSHDAPGSIYSTMLGATSHRHWGVCACRKTTLWDMYTVKSHSELLCSVLWSLQKTDCSQQKMPSTSILNLIGEQYSRMWLGIREILQHLPNIVLQFLFFSWGAHTDSRKLRLSPIFQVKKWEACKQ